MGFLKGKRRIQRVLEGVSGYIRTRKFATACMLSIALAAGGAVAPAAYARDPSTIRIVQAQPMTSFNANIQSLLGVGSVAELALEGLTQFYDHDGSLELAPELATSWEVVEPKRWRFHLREGVVFSDGTPFTSADVLASVKMMVEDHPGTFSTLFNRYKLEAPDDLTVDVITEVENEAAVPIRFSALRVFPAALIAKLGAEGVGQSPIGTGPYKVDTFQQGTSVDLSYNDKWWGKEPPIKHVNVRFITDASTRLQELMSGGADIINFVPATYADAIESNDQLKLVVAQTASRRTLFFNINSGVAANPEFRRALNYAVDREALVQAIGGRAVPIGGIYSFGETAFDPNYRPFPHDVAKARQILADAGISNPSIDMYVRDDQESARIGAQALQAQLAEAGVNVNILIGPNVTNLPKFTAGELEGMYYGEFSSSYPGEDRLFSSHFVNTASYSRAYKSEAATPMILELRSVIDMDARKKLLLELQKQLVEVESLWVPLYIEQDLYATAKDLHWLPRQGIKLNIEDAYFDQ